VDWINNTYEGDGESDGMMLLNRLIQGGATLPHLMMKIDWLCGQEFGCDRTIIIIIIIIVIAFIPIIGRWVRKKNHLNEIYYGEKSTRIAFIPIIGTWVRKKIT
jgi:hypothetical protein